MATKTIPADVRQDTWFHRVLINGKVHETLYFQVKSESSPYLELSHKQEKRLGVAVLGEVTDDPNYDWEHLDVQATKGEDDKKYWDDEEDEGYEPRSYLAGEDVIVQLIEANGTLGITLGPTYYGAMPLGSVKVDLDTIQNPEMRELASRMLSGAYRPAPATEDELREYEAS